MVGSELDTHARCAVDVDAVPIVFSLDGASQKSSPKAALGANVGRVENNDLPCDDHAVILPLCRERRAVPGRLTDSFNDLANCPVS